MKSTKTAMAKLRAPRAKKLSTKTLALTMPLDASVPSVPDVDAPLAAVAVDDPGQPVDAPTLVTVEHAAVAPVRTPRPVRSPAEKLGSELARFLRLHDRKPYASRGMQAIVDLAVEAVHEAAKELAAKELGS